MRVFEKVIAENGFAAGARKLELSPASVTRLVRDLEDHLGVRLLQRSTRQLALTAAGEAYLARLRHILSDIDEAEEAVHNHVREMSGCVRILSLPGMATHLVAPAIAGFRRLHPKVTLELESDMLAVRGVEGHDITLVTDQVPLPGNAVVRPVVRSENVLCASPDYLRLHGTPQSPQELQEHAFIRLAQPGVPCSPLELVHQVDPQQVQEAPVTPMLSCNDHEAVLRGTLEGVGISSQAVQVAAPLIRAGRLRRVLAPWLTERYMLLALFASRRYVPTRIRAFLDHLVQHAALVKVGIDTGACGEKPQDAGEAAHGPRADRQAPHEGHVIG
ncbi:MAG TPA: LysR substrate-binding domain-containing protein [Albitalea sp.]|nr:LysR substrate-binding domain-containing protein [Albitalea sp.]